MIPKQLPDILKLAEIRMKYLQSWGGHGFYKWPETFFEWLLDEIEEVKVEFELWKRVFLEDELGDVFWDYICLLESLELEWKIDKQKVFKRCFEKFSERLNTLDGSDNGDWQEVKKIQKERLHAEQSTY